MIAILFYLLIGLLTGLCAGLLGLGGGIVIVPTLTWVLTDQNFPKDHLMQLVIGSSFAAIALTSLMTIWSQHKRQAIRWNLLRWLVPLGVLGGLLGSGVIANYLPTASLKLIFALFCICLGVRLMLFRTHHLTHQVKPSKVYLAFIGLMTGILAGLLGIGGGIILIPLLTRAGIPLVQAGATSIAFVLPTVVSAMVGAILNGWEVQPLLPHWSLGYVYLPAALCIGLSSLVTAQCGVYLSHRLPQRFIQQTFALILFIVAWRMWP